MRGAYRASTCSDVVHSWTNMTIKNKRKYRDTVPHLSRLRTKDGSVGGSTGLIIPLLILFVYGRRKETEKEIVFVIREARYLMQDMTTCGDGVQTPPPSRPLHPTRNTDRRRVLPLRRVGGNSRSVRSQAGRVYGTPRSGDKHVFQSPRPSHSRQSECVVPAIVDHHSMYRGQPPSDTVPHFSWHSVSQ